MRSTMAGAGKQTYQNQYERCLQAHNVQWQHPDEPNRGLEMPPAAVLGRCQGHREMTPVEC